MSEPNEKDPSKNIRNETNEGEPPPEDPDDPRVGDIRITMEEPRTDGSVRITIEDSEQICEDADSQTNPITEETKKKLEEIIHLEDDVSKVARENIKTQREILVYALSTMLQNQLPPTGEVLSYEPSRNYFVRKVFTLVFLMLVTTSFGCAVVAIVEPLREAFTDPVNSLILILMASGTLFIMHYVMLCSSCSRIPPCNFVCLFITTMAFTIICCSIVLRYRVQIVFLAVFITTGVVGVCLLLSFTSFDFTKLILYCVVFGVAFTFLSMGVFCYMIMTGVYLKSVHLLLLIGSTLFSTFSLIMELQMVLGGKAIELGEDDYALGAYMLYTSIITLFLNIIQILGLLDE